MGTAIEALLSARGLGRRPETAAAQPTGDAPWLLRDVDLDLAAGESLLLWGSSGAGKTVLLRSLCGLDPVQTGAIRFADRPLADWPMPDYRSRVVYLHQRPVLFEGGVEDNLRRVFRLQTQRRRGHRFDRERILAWLAELGRDAAFLQRGTAQLSGGEQQMLALLRTLQLDPTVVLLDEPTASLDAEGVAAVERLIAVWRAEDPGRACIWSSHDERQALRVADRVVHLRQGRVVDPPPDPSGRSGASDPSGRSDPSGPQGPSDPSEPSPACDAAPGPAVPQRPATAGVAPGQPPAASPEDGGPR